MQSVEDLIAWQKAMTLVEKIYIFVDLIPDQEKFGLQSQLRRAAVSVPSNIAEGYGRCAPKDFSRFINMAIGSLNEIKTQIKLVSRLYPSSMPVSSDLQIEVEQVIRILIGLKKSLV